jgi:hypothetical protein
MPDETPTQLLRLVLDNLRTPERLDEHPWINAFFVQTQTADTPDLETKGPGYRLCFSVSKLFIEVIPSTPPKRGKRLDTRWGKFGILASHYFAPYLFGLPYPGSLRDAWGGIDRAILLCRFGDQISTLSVDEVSRYKLVGDESQVAAVSTLSDWHVKGIKNFAKFIDERENYLILSQPQLILVEDVPLEKEPEQPVHVVIPAVLPKKALKRWLIRLSAWLMIILVVAALTFAAGKGWKIYQLAQLIRIDISDLQSLVSTPISIEKIKTAGPRLSKIHNDIGNLRSEASPYLPWIGPALAWVPEYGADLAAASTLLDFADQLSATLQTGYQALTPFLQIESQQFNPQLLTRMLADAQPQFVQARQELDSAYEIRARLKDNKFSARTQGLLDRLDPLVTLLDDGLTAAISLPGLLGAGSSGPKSYMLLVQNEDELRPTGGFITSVGTFVVKNGNVFGMQFEEAGDLEDWSLPYPDAPWQLVRYMNSPVLVLRDANWFPDFPTTVDWVEYLYAYNHNNTVDGVIAIDQQLLVAILQVIGPLIVEGDPTPVTAGNVIEFMRESKVKPFPAPANFYRKAFISKIANALITRLLSGDNIDWRSMAEMMVRNLNERNILLKFDDPQVTALLAKYGWDGTVRPGNGDFLLAVDTNVGFNKTNAVVSSRLTYDVDLTDLAHPSGNLVVFHTNLANNLESCVQQGGYDLETAYPIHYCYWNYFRVFVPAGARLDSATPQAIPADWMLMKEAVPARVDPLPDDIPGLNGFGTMMVVPGGQTLETSFKLFLPQAVVSGETGSNQKTYTLKIQKQPGTQAVPVNIRIHLPASAQVEHVLPAAIVNGQNVLFETDLRTDVNISVTFSIH